VLQASVIDGEDGSVTAVSLGSQWCASSDAGHLADISVLANVRFAPEAVIPKYRFLTHRVAEFLLYRPAQPERGAE
jgi:hypothetical protein